VASWAFEAPSCTTDRDYTGDPADVKASEEEIAYLCAAASEYFRDASRVST
jgi:glycerol-3-phosphate dehydrogenase